MVDIFSHLVRDVFPNTVCLLLIVNQCDLLAGVVSVSCDSLRVSPYVYMCARDLIYTDLGGRHEELRSAVTRD